MTPEITHMRQCEARYVLTLKKENRGKFYAMVRKHRGDDAVAELISNVKTEWDKTPEWKKKQLARAA